MDQKLSILCIGTGAIGTYIGGSLALHGHHVTFIDQPEVIASLHSSGLSVEITGQNFTVENPDLSSSLGTVLEKNVYDLCLFALKSYDTDSAISMMLPFRDKIPSILCLQNGVDNEPKLTKQFGENRVIPGTVTSAVGKKGNGSIVLEKLRGVGIASGHSLSPVLVDAMNKAGLSAKIYPNAASMKWSKMLTNLLANASSAILDMTPSQILADPALFRLEVTQLREALNVMKKQNILVTDLPGTPVRLLAFAVKSLPFSISKIALARAVGRGRGAKMPSFHIDLYSNRGRSEVGYLNGAVVRSGEKYGIPTPINGVLCQVLQDLTDKKIPISSFKHQPGKLLELSKLP